MTAPDLRRLLISSFERAGLRGWICSSARPAAALAGFVLIGAGVLLMAGLAVSSGWLHLLPGMIAAGAGGGLVTVPLASTAVGVVHVSQAGMASGINATARPVGLAAGIAALGAVLATRTQGSAPARAGFVGGLNEILLIGAIVAFAAAVLSAVLIRQRGRGACGPPPCSLPGESQRSTSSRVARAWATSSLLL